MNHDDLKDKRALITGASGGLGLHFARLLAGYGVEVTLAARQADKLQKSCKGLAGATHLALDVCDAVAIQAALEGVPQPFDILVNNAGVSGAEPAQDVSEESWDKVLDTNLKGAFFLAQGCARGMRERGGGAIINIASILGHRVAGGVSSYAASKAALIQMTRALSLEWARDGIRVNALCPGYIETDINADFFKTQAGQAMIRRIPQRRLGRPGDLDGPLLLLASDAGRYITGTTLAVDGGHLNSTL